MITAGSLRNGSYTSKPIMTLVFECQVWRSANTYTGVGSLNVAYAVLPGIIPCDISPLTDELYLQEVGQSDIITHILHVPAGTNIRVRDAVKIIRSQTGFGPIGLSFYVKDVLLPSELISYVRCRVTLGKDPTTGVV